MYCLVCFSIVALLLTHTTMTIKLNYPISFSIFVKKEYNTTWNPAWKYFRFERISHLVAFCEIWVIKMLRFMYHRKWFFGVLCLLDVVEWEGFSSDIFVNTVSNNISLFVFIQIEIPRIMFGQFFIFIPLCKVE